MSPRNGLALASAAVLGVWAAAMWFLDLTDRWALLLSTRTHWVLPLGGALLTVGAIARGVSALREAGGSNSRVERRHVLTLGVVALPAVVLLAMPGATLGAAAASNRGGVGAAYVSGLSVSGTGPPTLTEVAAARYSPDVLRLLAKRAGARVTYTGFVRRGPGTPSDQFLLTRFVITCCIADALVAEVRVVGLDEQHIRTNDWVRVTGRIYPVRDAVLLLADAVRSVPRPAHPYITP